ncbi:MAG: hypothetical protein K9N49_04845 [Candidatus Marinimicrobia bacterium]|nr:hypothetical protein [Candidatus Neomarinimicrobiota bacterium]
MMTHSRILPRACWTALLIAALMASPPPARAADSSNFRRRVSFGLGLVLLGVFLYVGWQHDRAWQTAAADPEPDPAPPLLPTWRLTPCLPAAPAADAPQWALSAGLALEYNF